VVSFEGVARSRDLKGDDLGLPTAVANSDVESRTDALIADATSPAVQQALCLGRMIRVADSRTMKALRISTLPRLWREYWEGCSAVWESALRLRGYWLFSRSWASQWP